MKKIFMILIIAIAIIGCDNTPDTHTHTFGDWQSNAEQHWKECGCGEKTDIGNHTGNPCTICGYEKKAVPQPTQKTLTFGKVTISSEDEHLPSAWIELCNDVVTALESAYTGGGNAHRSRCDTVFGGNGAKIVLVNGLTNNWEVRDDEFGTLYLKTGSIATATYGDAVRDMASSAQNVG